MARINGYTVIAFKPSDKLSGATAIVAARADRNSAHGFEYVTALVETIADSEWYWGHYFFDMGDAYADFLTR